LTAQTGLSPEQADTVAAFSGGSHTRSLAMIEGNWFRLRDWVVKEFQQLPQMPAGQLLALAGKLAEHTELLSETLAVLISWLRDLLICRFYPAGTIHRDLRKVIQKLAEKTPVDRIMGSIQAVRRAQADLHSNASARLIMETLLLQLASDGVGCGSIK
jgi:DNA polymerase-3 subunit delta'